MRMKPLCLSLLAFGLLAVPQTASAADDVTCSNPAGSCTVGQDSGECECLNGDGAGWSDGYNPDDPPEDKTEEELLAQCEEELVRSCGEDPPALPETCEGDVLDDCEAFVAAEDAMIEACGDEVPAVNIARVGNCCDNYDNAEYAGYRQCVTDSDEATCEALNSCEDAGPLEDDADEGSAQAEEMDEDKAGCSVGGRGSAGALLALLGLIPFFRRRRQA